MKLARTRMEISKRLNIPSEEQSSLQQRNYFRFISLEVNACARSMIGVIRCHFNATISTARVASTFDCRVALKLH